jgi:hypothetical protein
VIIGGDGERSRDGMPEGGVRYPWLWDVEMDNPEFDAILAGRGARPGFDQRWALVRLIDYAPYREIKRLLRRSDFQRLWPEVSFRVRSPSRRRGMEFVARWFANGSRS